MILAEQKEHPQMQDHLQKPDRTGSHINDQDRSSNFFELLGHVSTLAWNLVIPIVGGVLLGYYLDSRTDGELTWTLSLLVLGVLIAFSNLYNLYIEHGRQNPKGENRTAEHEENDDQEK